MSESEILHRTPAGVSFPLGTRYVANMDVPDRDRYTPEVFHVLGEIGQVPVGNTIVRAGFTKSKTDHRWEQILHVVLTPAEREELIAALIAHRSAAPVDAVEVSHV